MNSTINRLNILLSLIIINLCIGAVYTFSIFALPLTTIFNTSTGEISIAFTINAITFPISMILGGKLVDTEKAKIAIILGGFLFALGFTLSGLATSVWMLYVTYGLVTGMGQGIVYSATIGNTIKLFPDKQGLAAGIITASYGGGSIFISPIAHALIIRHGVQLSLIILGIAFLIIILGASFFVKSVPVGYLPDGWAANKSKNTVHIPWKQMIKTPIFYVITSIFLIGALSGIMMAANTSIIGQTIFGFSAVTAALYVSLYSFSNCIGRVFFGAVSDKIGESACLLIIYLIVATMMLVTSLTTSIIDFIIIIVGMGLCFGGIMGIFPSIVAKTFGTRYYGVNYGIIFIGYSLAAFFGSQITDKIIPTNLGMYTMPFYLSLFLLLTTLVLIFTYYSLEKKTITSDPPLFKEHNNIILATLKKIG